MQYKQLLILLAFIGLGVDQAAAHLGDNLYPVSSIAAELRENADAVVRYEKTTFRIISIGKAIEVEEKAITILNAKGDRYAQKVLGYDKLSKVNKLEGALYAADGKLIRRLKKSDIYDRSAFSDVNFVMDNRYKIATLEHKLYPFTVVWTTEVETTNTMFYPTWGPSVSEKVAVEESQFQVICPKGYNFRHRSYGLPDPQISTDKDGNTNYQWTERNLIPTEIEPLAYYWEDSKYVLTAPVEFEVEGFKGNMQNWEQLGLFMNQLLKGRDNLPLETQEKVKQLTAGLATPEEKIKAVYEYMQKNTRYLSIQLGIGGWQPFEAAFVQQKGYGDCKALSNYTKALLKAIGIDSHYTIIKAGADAKSTLLEDFPKSYFNHVILCVPQERDTIWLECTSQTNPFAHLGSFTGNRKALLITEKGGKLVNTRQYSAADNFRSSKTTIDLKQEQPVYTLSRRYGGVQFDAPHYWMSTDPQQQKKWLYEDAGLPGVTLKNHQFKVATGKEPIVLLEADGILTEKQSRAGNRIFVPLSLGKLPLDAPRPVPNRKTDFVQDWGYTYTDTLIYKITDTFKPEHLPDPQHIKTSFGEYELKAAYQNGQLMSVATLSLYPGRYPAAQYADWVTFVQQIRSAHAAKAVLVSEP